MGEKDPLGFDQHEAGAKLDSGKPDLSLFFESFPRAIFAVTQVADFGAKKYTRGGWREVPNGILRYESAGARHMLARHTGEVFDKDSGFPHRYHEVWNALAQLELELVAKEEAKEVL